MALFRAGLFFEAHEAWEIPWRAATGRDRCLLQGLIQVAAACIHARAGRPAPARRLFGRALARLRDAGPSVDSGGPFGVPLAELLEKVASAPEAFLDSPLPPDPATYFPLAPPPP